MSYFSERQAFSSVASVGTLPNTDRAAAFSLVELSIVLVILGLLTGGILTGQNLIRAAELRSVTTQMNEYRTAMYTFRDKYFYLPGDMPNATDFWGADPDGCPTHSNWKAGKKETCNGDGDGIIGDSGEKYERFRFWQQLANAGLIEGSYSGVTGPEDAGTCVGVDHEPGFNSPKGKFGNSGFSVVNDNVDTAPYLFIGSYTNAFAFGGVYTACATLAPILTPEEAWNIDTKLDDGKPGTGKIRPRNNYASGGQEQCTDGTTSSASYGLGYKSAACALYFLSR